MSQSIERADPRRGRWAAPRARRGLAIVLATCAVAVMIGAVRLGAVAGVEARPVGPPVLAIADGARGPGVLEASRRVTISATTAGRIEDLCCDEGAVVEESESLVWLEAYGAEIDVETALFTALAAAFRLDEAKASLKREQASEARAELLLSRAQPDDAAEASAVLAAERDAARARVSEAEARIGRLQAALAAAQSVVERRREDLQQATLIAPFDGVVLALKGEIGEVVAPGAPILELVDPNSLLLRARFDAALLGSLESGAKAVVALEAQPGRRYEAHIHRVGRKVDARTGQIIVDLRIETPPETWALGQSGWAEILPRDATSAGPAPTSAPTDADERRDGVVPPWEADRADSALPASMGARRGASAAPLGLFSQWLIGPEASI